MVHNCLHCQINWRNLYESVRVFLVLCEQDEKRVHQNLSDKETRIIFFIQYGNRRLVELHETVRPVGTCKGWSAGRYGNLRDRRESKEIIRLVSFTYDQPTRKFLMSEQVWRTKTRLTVHLNAKVRENSKYTAFVASCQRKLLFLWSVVYIRGTFKFRFRFFFNQPNVSALLLEHKYNSGGAPP